MGSKPKDSLKKGELGNHVLITAPVLEKKKINHFLQTAGILFLKMSYFYTVSVDPQF